MRKTLQIGALKRGAIVRNKLSGDSYIIDQVFGVSAIGIRTVNVTNPDEWVLIDAATGQPRDSA